MIAQSSHTSATLVLGVLLFVTEACEGSTSWRDLGLTLRACDVAISHHIRLDHDELLVVRACGATLAHIKVAVPITGEEVHTVLTVDGGSTDVAAKFLIRSVLVLETSL